MLGSQIAQHTSRWRSVCVYSCSSKSFLCYNYVFLVLILYLQPGLQAGAIAKVQELSVHNAKVKTRRGIKAESA
jgi:hypothetical protein